MIEREYKFLLTEKQFHTALKKAAALYGASKEKTQINHYYDDEILSLNRQGMTVRIRQSGGAAKLQIKRHGGKQKGYVTSDETEEDIAGAPEKLILPVYGCLTLKGTLATHRRSFAARPGVILDMDKNTYLGMTDYETEIEFNADAQKNAETVVSELKWGSANNEGKSTRFFKRFSAQKNAAPERKGKVDGT